ERNAAERNLYFADMRLANEAWQSGEIGRLEEILGRYGDQASGLDQRGWEWYYLYSLGHQYRVLRGHTTPVEAVVWSPDGKRLASPDWKGTKIWDLDTDREAQTLPGTWADWRPDGEYFAGQIEENVIGMTALATARIGMK